VVEPDAPLACSVVSRVSETSDFVGVQVVVVPRALTVRTPGDSVDVPLAPGLYVPVRSGMSIGSPDLMAAELVGPSTWTVPLSAPPRTTSIDGFTESAGMSAGLSITDPLNFTVRS
jgi:hypothetical protein